MCKRNNYLANCFIRNYKALSLICKEGETPTVKKLFDFKAIATGDSSNDAIY